jgi:hypothetical protein
MLTVEFLNFECWISFILEVLACMTSTSSTDPRLECWISFNDPNLVSKFIAQLLIVQSICALLLLLKWAQFFCGGLLLCHCLKYMALCLSIKLSTCVWNIHQGATLFCYPFMLIFCSQHEKLILFCMPFCRLLWLKCWIWLAFLCWSGEIKSKI